jgi:hypothetical protein
MLTGWVASARVVVIAALRAHSNSASSARCHHAAECASAGQKTPPSAETDMRKRLVATVTTVLCGVREDFTLASGNIGGQVGMPGHVPR